jgi:radical SAM/Cys-rich protein
VSTERTLSFKRSALTSPDEQLRILNSHSDVIQQTEKFDEKVKKELLGVLKPDKLEIFQLNLGKMCNQVCKHCHVDAGPDRKEMISKEYLLKVLDLLKDSSAHTVDLTGGAPEMHPHFKFFVTELSKLNKKIIVRCNLTIILANSTYNDLPEFFKQHKVHVVSSLPFYETQKTDRQRGDGVFEKSIKALKMLNEVGYGKPEEGLILDLVYNPNGAFLPADQVALEKEFKQQLLKKYNIVFNNLFTITNMPISRYLNFLLDSGNFEDYMQKLVSAFNPAALRGVMCKNTISVSWDGQIYDCDFNQMLDMVVDVKKSKDLLNFDESELSTRNIRVNQHCYGCTAGSGSSCGGATV